MEQIAETLLATTRGEHGPRIRHGGRLEIDGVVVIVTGLSYFLRDGVEVDVAITTRPVTDAD